MGALWESGSVGRAYNIDQINTTELLDRYHI